MLYTFPISLLCMPLNQATKLSGTNNIPPLQHAGLGIRFIAGIIDLIVLIVPFSVFVSFLAVGMNLWNSFFFEYHTDRPIPLDLVRKGPTFIWLSLTFFILTSWLYFAFLESSPWRGTVGKHFLGLHLADEQGAPITFWQASKRFSGGRLLIHVPTVGLFYFLIDCLCIKASPHSQAIHDRLAHCFVLQEPPTLDY